MKLPFLQFYTGDWLTDPTVSALSPATRGIWLDLICCMATGDRTGVLTGYKPALARLGRCSADELAGALNELTMCKTAEVVEADNGIVTVTNRRMAREHKERIGGALRQQRHREGGGGNALVTPSSRDILQRSESRVQKSEGGYDKVSKPFQGGGATGGGALSLTKLQAEVARFSEEVLNGQWVNDAGKWMERIKADPQRVLRVMAEVSNAAREGRIKTTPAQMAQWAWEQVMK